MSLTATHNHNTTQRTSPPWWWSRLPLQRHGINESMPPKGQAALRISFPRPLSEDFVWFNKLRKNSSNALLFWCLLVMASYRVLPANNDFIDI
jgi:hypothetical protein